MVFDNPQKKKPQPIMHTYILIESPLKVPRKKKQSKVPSKRYALSILYGFCFCNFTVEIPIIKSFFNFK